MTTASPPGYSRLFATGLFLSTDVPSHSVSGSGSRSATPTPISPTPHTPAFETPHAYTGSATLVIPHSSRSTRRPKLAALRTHSARASTGSSGPLSAGTTPTSASVPPSPRVPRRRRSSLTMAHNPIAAIKSPTRAAGMSGRTQAFMQALASPAKERRTWSLDALGERSFESVKSDVENTPAGNVRDTPRPRRAVVARKPAPTAPLPTPPIHTGSILPMLTLNTNFPSPNSLSPALTPSPNILPAPTPGAIDLGLHKFSFANHKLSASRPTRSPLVTSVNNGVAPGYFDVPIRMSSPALPENEMDLE